MVKLKYTKNKKTNTVYHSRRSKTTGRGFTLMELLVSVFIFSLVMISVVALFARFVTVQKRSRAIQQNMEDARYAMELMAKTLRTSSVLNHTTERIEVYDYSQEKCINYFFDSASSKINSQSADGPDRGSCGVFSTPNSMVGNNISKLNFTVTPSSPGTVGKATISMVICSNSGCSGSENDKAAMQTTVSLRDYGESNP